MSIAQYLLKHFEIIIVSRKLKYKQLMNKSFQLFLLDLQ